MCCGDANPVGTLAIDLALGSSTLPLISFCTFAAISCGPDRFGATSASELGLAIPNL